MSTTKSRSKMWDIYKIEQRMMWNIYNIEQKQNMDCLQHRATAGSEMSTTYSKIKRGISITQRRVECEMCTT